MKYIGFREVPASYNDRDTGATNRYPSYDVSIYRGLGEGSIKINGFSQPPPH